MKLTNKKFHCQYASGHQCANVADVPCCYYCKNILKCYLKCRDGESYYCPKSKDDNWCRTAEKFITKNGYYNYKPKPRKNPKAKLIGPCLFQL